MFNRIRTSSFVIKKKCFSLVLITMLFGISLIRRVFFYACVYAFMTNHLHSVISVPKSQIERVTEGPTANVCVHKEFPRLHRNHDLNAFLQNSKVMVLGVGVFRSSSGQEGRTFINGIRVLSKEIPERFIAPLHHVRTQ